MRRFLKSFVYAGHGLRRCLRERNFRFDVCAAVYVLCLSPYATPTRGEWALLLLTIAAVLAAEAGNTALEALTDFLSPTQHPLAAAAKDCAAGAVLLTALGAVGVGVAVLCHRATLVSLLSDFGNHLYKPVVLLLSLPVAVVWIFHKEK